MSITMTIEFVEMFTKITLIFHYYFHHLVPITNRPLNYASSFKALLKWLTIKYLSQILVWDGLTVKRPSYLGYNDRNF